MFKIKDDFYSKVKSVIVVNKTTILCTASIICIIGVSFVYGSKLNLELKSNAIQSLHDESPEQLAELVNLNNPEYISQLNVEGNLVYYDESISINTVDKVLDCFVSLPKDLQRLILGTAFKVKLTQFLDGVDGVTFYADRVILVEEFSRDVTETTYHEFGHLLNAFSDINNNSSRVNEVFKSESHLYQGKMKSYITSSPSEYYAGSFLEYMLNSDKLKEERPKTYKLIKSDISSLSDISTHEASKHLNTYIKFGENIDE